jgi:hypothetical protein
MRNALIALAFAAIVFVLCAYVHVTSMWFCPLCARVQLRSAHIFHIPYRGALRIQAGVQDRPDTVITKLLDPDAACAHSWRPNGYNGSGLIYGCRAIGLDPTLSPVIYESDFGEFLDAWLKREPNLAEKMREKLNSEELRDWLADEYDKWTVRD